MKRMVFCCVFLALLICLPQHVPAAPPVAVEILYMNHGPMMPTVKEIRNLCSRYDKKNRRGLA